MTTAVNQYREMSDRRFKQWFPRSLMQSFLAKSKPHKFGVNPHIEMCLSIPNSAVKWLVTGCNFNRRVLYAIHTSSGKQNVRGAFSIDELLKNNRVVRMEDFKPQSWFRYCYTKHGKRGGWT